MLVPLCVTYREGINIAEVMAVVAAKVSGGFYQLYTYASTAFKSEVVLY